QSDRRIAQGELGLPDREQDIDEIGIAVVERVHGKRDAHRPPLVLRRGGPVLACSRGREWRFENHRGRRGANNEPEQENSGSSVWLRKCTTPRLRSTTSSQGNFVTESFAEGRARCL